MTQVRCINNTGHEKALIVGRLYDLSAHQPTNTPVPYVRIRRDEVRGPDVAHYADRFEAA